MAGVNTTAAKLLRLVLIALALCFCLLNSVSADFQHEEQQVLLDPALDGTLNDIQYEAAKPQSPPAPQAAADKLELTPAQAKAKAKILLALQREDQHEEVKDDHPRYWLLRALYGFWRHGERFQQEVAKKSARYSELGIEHRRRIEDSTDYSDIYGKVYERHKINGDLSRAIAKAGMKWYDVDELELQQYITVQEYNENWDNQERVNEALQHLYRDWTSEGEHERANASAAILQILERQFPDRKDNNIKVLCPGSGLGRIPQNIAALGGFDVTANELSSYMRISYHFMETLLQPHQEVFHPFIDWWSYQPDRYEMIRPVTFPDAVLNRSAVTLVEGDFTEEFNELENHFDAVVTFYFMDTAVNMLEYLDVLHKVLKPGGVWINLGPLLYHEAIVEFSLDDVLRVAEGYDFEFLDTDEYWGPLTLPHHKARTLFMSYMVHEKSIRMNMYKAQLFAAVKKS